MKLYLELLLVALLTIYIVDLSGFTDSWRNALARFLNTRSLRSLKPFDCGKCMTWWVTLIYTIASGHLTVCSLAFCGLLSFFSLPIGQGLILIREWVLHFITKASPKR